jgi:predicted RNase H-like HicB family nuclease
MASYIGLIRKDPASDWGVEFPDFPGCVTAGTDLDDAHRMAREALAFHISGMLEDGEAIPEPSSLAAVMEDPGNEGTVAILVSVPTETVRAVRINVTLPSDVLARLDSYAESHGFTRSRLLAEGARKILETA